MAHQNKSPPMTAQAGTRMLTTLAHTFATKFRHVDKGGTVSFSPRMFCVAVLGDDHVFGVSGGITQQDGGSADPYPAYLRQYKDFLPWKGAPPIPPNGRGYENCAEAHVWLELRGRSKNPKLYTIASFNSAGEFAAPCQNCQQWVGKSFRYVDTPSRAYEGHPKQKTTYRA